MRKLGTWGIAASLLLSLSGAARAGDDAKRPPPRRYGSKTVFESLLGPNVKKTSAKAEKAKKTDQELPAAKPEAVPTAASILEDEQAKLDRRWAVCLKLMQIATETNDRDLERTARELEQRAWDVYQERTAHLSTGPRESDQGRLEKQLPVNAPDAARRLSPEAPVSRLRGIEGSAAAREVKP